MFIFNTGRHGVSLFWYSETLTSVSTSAPNAGVDLIVGDDNGTDDDISVGVGRVPVRGC